MCWGKSEFIAYMCAKSFQLCPTLCDPTDYSLSGSSVQGIPSQGYWSGLPSPIPGDLPNPGIKPSSLAFPTLAGRFFPTALEPGLGPQKPCTYHTDSPDLLSTLGPSPREKDHQPVPWVDSQTFLLTAPRDSVPHQNPRHL